MLWRSRRTTLRPSRSWPTMPRKAVSLSGEVPMELSFTPPDSDAAVDWALAYAACGMAVFPVKADKKPLTEHGLKDATTDEAQIRAWWARDAVRRRRLGGPSGDRRRRSRRGPRRRRPQGFLRMRLRATPTTSRRRRLRRRAAAAISSSTPMAGRTRTASSSTARRSIFGRLAATSSCPAPTTAARGRSRSPRRSRKRRTWIHARPAAELGPPTEARPFAGETPYAAAALERACLAIEPRPTARRKRR